MDFLIDCGNGKIKSYFSYMAFVLDLEDELKCHVDVVTTGISDKDFLNMVKKDEVSIYAIEETRP